MSNNFYHPHHQFPHHNLAISQASYLAVNGTSSLGQVKTEDLNKWRDMRDKEKSLNNCMCIYFNLFLFYLIVI